jgi:murein DD-endopeptidase MepM/ murein hydrolase activator NlpD
MDRTGFRRCDNHSLLETRCRRSYLMREKRRHLIGALAVLSVTALNTIEVVGDAHASTSHDQAGYVEQLGKIAFPFDSALKYPFTKRDSLKCGRWRSRSQDYPYFGAPRDGSARRHVGIDLYPVEGAGVPIKAIQDGTVIRIAPFYKRHSGETTYALLIDHKGYVANYAELSKPMLVTGAVVRKNETIGFVSGTKHLHFELYTPGARGWMSWSWYGEMPLTLIDPTEMMTRAARERYPPPDLTLRSRPPAKDAPPILREARKPPWT